MEKFPYRNNKRYLYERFSIVESETFSRFIAAELTVIIEKYRLHVRDS